MFLRACILLLAALAVADSANAQAGVWRATGPDGAAAVGAISGLDIDDDGLVASVGGETIRASRLLHLVPPGTGRAGGAFRLHLANGDILRGDVADIDEAAITLRTLDFGDVRVPLEQAVALLAFGTGGGIGQPATAGPRPLSDEVLLANGDRVSGFLASLAEGQLTLEQDDGSTLTLPLDAVERVAFADGGAVAQANAGVARLVLSDWSTITATALELGDDGRWQVTYNNDAVSLEPTLVFAVEPAEARSLFLADATPSETRYQPYFGASFPPRRMPGLESVVAAGPTPGRSIETRSRTRLTFDVPPGEFNKFLANFRIGVEGEELPQASVHVRVLLDGEVAAERLEFTQEGGVGQFDVPLGGAATVTLEVDYADRLDVQDRLIWVEPRLVCGSR